MIKISKYSVPTSDSRVSNLFNIHTSLSFQRNNDRTHKFTSSMHDLVYGCIWVHAFLRMILLPGPQKFGEKKMHFNKREKIARYFNLFVLHIQSCEHWKLQLWSSIELLIHVFNAVILDFFESASMCTTHIFPTGNGTKKDKKTYKP